MLPNVGQNRTFVAFCSWFIEEEIPVRIKDYKAKIKWNKIAMLSKPKYSQLRPWRVKPSTDP
jgi:hypothetical protein